MINLSTVDFRYYVNITVLGNVGKPKVLGTDAVETYQL